MSDTVRVRVVIDGVAIDAVAGISIAAVLANAGLHARRSVSGEPRAALCGMGVCHECRVAIDGLAHQRACMVFAAEGMVVDRDA